MMLGVEKAIAENEETEFEEISKIDDRGKFKQTLTIPRNAEVVDELANTARARLVEGDPLDGSLSWVFDFLTCKVSEGEGPYQLHWVEIKSGSSMLSKHQEEVRRGCKIPFSVFRISGVDGSPYKVEIEWEFDSARR
jgi:hypothetical protein